MITEKEKKNRDELFRLMQENPDLPVVPMVDSDIVVDDGYNLWMGSWGDSHIEEYVLGKKYLHFREDDDWGEIEWALADGFVGYETFEGLSDEEAKSEYAALPWIRAIIVNIDLPEYGYLEVTK